MNEHVKEYCENFIESPESPHFALFIKGDWGTGKTYFINKLIEQYGKDTDIKDSDIIKISLFGVRTSDDIDLKIYQAIHPFLSSKGMKIAGAVFRSAIKLGTNIELGDGKNSLNLSADGTLITQFGNDKKVSISKKLLIVDDFERASMEPCDIFGYFSEIISESDTRVIFIGNEEKIVKNDEKNREYFQIKEKTIGMEFQIEPDFDEAINQFVNDLSLAENSTDEVRDKLRKIVAEIAEKLECKNLRTIRQALFNLNLFMDVIDNFDDEDKETCIIIFLMLFIQKSMKFIENREDTETAIHIYFNAKLSYQKYCEQHIENKDSFDLNYYNYRQIRIPLLNHWASIIFEGNYRGELLKASYENEKKIIEESQENSRKALFKLLHYYDMDKATFSQTLEKTDEEFISGKYLHPGEILHYANIMLFFADMKIIPESVDEIQSRILKFLDDKKDRIIPVFDLGIMSDCYGGYAYDFKVPKVSDIFEIIKKLNDENVVNQIKINIENDLLLLKTDLSMFCNKIANEYPQHPILSYWDPEDFYKKFSEISAGNQELVFESLEKRYGKIYSNGRLPKEYCADYENLKILATRYTEDNEDCLYNPQAYIKKGIAKRWMDLVRYFEEKYPELKNNNA
ncbi:AAA family ATPase [bacterium]|nr:AAA family ATPase [bacterium]